MEGDFNKTVDFILWSRRITRTAATFAFLDQRNMECHWETVRKLAQFKRQKIEIMYFLGTSWSMRSMKSASRPDTLAAIERWWGRPDWQELKSAQQSQLPLTFSNRFTDELGYEFVNFYPILLNEDGSKQQSQLPLTFSNRFTDELGYEFVNFYPILLNEDGSKVAFHLIHASDHPQAPVLMTRAYRKICGEIANSPADNQMGLLDWDGNLMN